MFHDIDEDDKAKNATIEDYEKPMNPLDPKNSIKPLFTYFYLIYKHMMLIPSSVVHVLMVCALYMIWLMMEAHRETDDWIFSALKPIKIRRLFLWGVSLINFSIIGHFAWCYKNKH